MAKPSGIICRVEGDHFATACFFDGHNFIVGIDFARNDSLQSANEIIWKIWNGSQAIAVLQEGNSSESGTIRLGTSGLQTNTFIAGIRGVTTGVADGVTVVIDSNGQLGTVSSSRRFKEDIENMDEKSSGLLNLRPVTFRYKQPSNDGSQPVQYGLIAEEVAEVFPDLVVYGQDGQVETVQYHKLTAMLLNEIQKQHKVNQAQEVQLRTQIDQNRALVQQIKELTTQVTNVKAQVGQLGDLAESLTRLKLKRNETPVLSLQVSAVEKFVR